MKYYNFGCKVLTNSAWAFREKSEDYLGNEHISDIVLNNSLGFLLYLKIYTRKREKILITESNISEVKHLWVDMQPNEFAYPLMSTRMKELIESHLTGEEGIVWVPVDVIGPDEKRIYYIPRFTKELDVLDEKKQSMTFGRMVLKLYLSHIFREKKLKIILCFINLVHFGKL